MYNRFGPIGLLTAFKAVYQHFHSLTIAIIIRWYIGSLVCDR